MKTCINHAHAYTTISVIQREYFFDRRVTSAVTSNRAIRKMPTFDSQYRLLYLGGIVALGRNDDATAGPHAD